eukprot:TRINITY_DN18538_c0_g1_i1.p1 TRINITY_DN18538_c0_g1~~TRINITY_DN18538_c0_g1_i1.p1  ORF type:complete len:774 (+),score=220.61 TRINITY_DN18538_c0_g1_i1:98-2419(+)
MAGDAGGGAEERDAAARTIQRAQHDRAHRDASQQEMYQRRLAVARRISQEHRAMNRSDVARTPPTDVAALPKVTADLQQQKISSRQALERTGPEKMVPWKEVVDAVAADVRLGILSPAAARDALEKARERRMQDPYTTRAQPSESQVRLQLDVYGKAYSCLPRQEKSKRDRAARTIQAAHRGYSTRRMTAFILVVHRTQVLRFRRQLHHDTLAPNDRRRRERAARVLQAWVVGNRVRERVRQMRTQLRYHTVRRVHTERQAVSLDPERRVRAATHIQRFVRGRRARIVFHLLTAITRAARAERVAEERFIALGTTEKVLVLGAASKLQAFARGALARRRYHQMQVAYRTAQRRRVVAEQYRCDARQRPDKVQRAGTAVARIQGVVRRWHAMRLVRSRKDQLRRVNAKRVRMERAAPPAPAVSTCPAPQMKFTAAAEAPPQTRPALLDREEAAVAIQKHQRGAVLRRRMKAYTQDRTRAVTARVEEERVMVHEAQQQQTVSEAEVPAMQTPPAVEEATPAGGVVETAAASLRRMQDTYEEFVAKEGRKVTSETEAARQRLRQRVAETEAAKVRARNVAERNRRELMALEEAAEQRAVRKVLETLEKDAAASSTMIAAEEQMLRERKIELSREHAGEMTQLARRKVLMAGDGYWPDEHCFSAQSQAYSVWTNKAPHQPPDSPSTAFRRRWVRNSLSKWDADEAAACGVEEALRRAYAADDKIVIGPLVFTGRALNEMREGLARDMIAMRPQPPPAARPCTSPARRAGRPVPAHQH